VNVVIVGAKERNTEADRAVVCKLLELATATYSDVMFVTMWTHTSVGQFVKEEALKKDSHNQFRHQFIDLNLRIYARDVPNAQFVNYYIARNATLFELGDVFIYLANTKRQGTLEDLIQNRVIPSGRPYVVLLPGEPASLPELK
jgi:hypothetical protein